MKPNVLLIMVDQMRYDCLSILNHPVVDTPNLDQLARDGVLFENAYSATPTCVPARATVLTGMSQNATGKVGYEERVPFDYKRTIAHEFTKGGYHTQAVGKMHVYPARNLAGFHNVVLHDGYLHYNRMKKESHMAESFDETDDYLPWLRERAGSQVDLLDLGLDCNASTVSRPWHLKEEWHPTNWTVTQSIDFLRRRDPSKPFFLKMSFVRPHSPLDPPQYYYDMYKDLDMPEPPIGDWVDTEDEELKGFNPITDRGVVPKQRLKRAQAAYYGLITHIDHQIGRFMQSLIEYGEYNNTVMLFVSDHGELMGDHHLFRKSFPYEGSSHIPFILADPGNVLHLKKNTRNEATIELKDVMPTLLDAAGLPIPETVEGKSVLSLLKEAPIDWREYIHGEHYYGKESYHSITTNHDKYIWYSQTGVEQYFNLEKDPEEKVNLINDADYQKQIESRRQQLIEELKDREEGFTDGQVLIVGQEIKPTLSYKKQSKEEEPTE